jgi:hypothetical protein
MPYEKNGKKNNSQDLAILAIQKDIEYIKLAIDDIKNNHLKALNDEITDIKKQLSSRPTWAITFLTSLCLAMLIFILTNYFLH